MEVLIVGGSGFLGSEVVRQSLAAGDRVAATYHSGLPTTLGAAWHRVDIRDRQEITDLLATTRPDLVINTAFQQADRATTAVGATHVAVAAASTAARLVQVSSDAVFSGRATHYDETALPDPITPYGAAKAAAETAIAAISPTAVIARTSLIIGDGDSAHERFVHRLAREQPTEVLFTDDVRCPIHVVDLASALLELAASDKRRAATRRGCERGQPIRAGHLDRPSGRSRSRGAALGPTSRYRPARPDRRTAGLFPHPTTHANQTAWCPRVPLSAVPQGLTGRE